LLLEEEQVIMTNNAKILIVDDSKLNRAVIRKTLSELDMTLTECVDGEEALEHILTESFDLVLTDTVMPRMDGIELIKEIKQNKDLDFIPVILMTGNDSVDSKIMGLNIGADDFLQKPINQKELVARVYSLLRLKKMHDLLFEKNKLIENELEAAKKVQQFIIPENFDFIDYPKVSGFYKPMEDIGGDFYDCYNLPRGKKGFLIADVTGHGIPAALVVTMAKMIFNIYASQFLSTKELFTLVNNEVHDLLLTGQYLTSFYAIYDDNKKILRFSNAGHVLPLLYKKKSGKIFEIDTDKGFFIGIMKDCEYDQKAVKIEEGDRLFLYTDGLTELKNSEKEEYGIERLMKFIKKNATVSGDNFCKKLYNDAMSHSHKKIRNDDIAFLYIEF
jgi:serine phosphatase RsbU (regulator of sigma subunit)